LSFDNTNRVFDSSNFQNEIIVSWYGLD
jgi:hypothetical protein